MDNTDAAVRIERTRTPHAVYLAIGVGIVLILAGGVGFALYELVLIERNVNQSAAASAQTLSLVNQALTGTHKNGDDGLLFLTKNLLQNGAAGMNALKQTMQDANKIAKAEQPKTVALADSSIALVNTTNGTVARLGGAVDALSAVIAKVDTETLPKVNDGVDSLNGLVSDLRPTAQASTALLNETTGAVTELKGSIVTANALLADPELATIVHNLALTSANANTVAANLGLVTMDVHNMLNPKKTTFWEALAMTAAKSVLGSAAGPVISHFWPLGINVENTPLPVTLTPK